MKASSSNMVPYAAVPSRRGAGSVRGNVASARARNAAFSSSSCLTTNSRSITDNRLKATCGSGEYCCDARAGGPISRRSSSSLLTVLVLSFGWWRIVPAERNGFGPGLRQDPQTAPIPFELLQRRARIGRTSGARPQAILGFTC